MIKNNWVTCVCCGYKTLAEWGNYEICPVCYWEDDPSQIEYPDGYGANPLSLREAQRNYTEFGACEVNMKRHVRTPSADEEPDPDWKPLDQQ